MDEAVTTETPEEAPVAAPAVGPASSPAPQVNGGEAPSDAVPAYWPEDWRDHFVGEKGDPKLRQHLNRFTTPEGIFKAWRSLEKQRNNGMLKPARPETDDEAQLAAWRKEVGAPEAPDGYYDGLEYDEGSVDKGSLDRMFGRMHDLGVPKDQAKEVVTEYMRMQQEQQEAVVAQDNEFRRKAEDHLRGEWGPEYRQNINAIGVLFEQHGSKELFSALESARFADGRRFADDPGAVMFLANIARELHPDSNIIVSPNSGMSRQQAISSELDQLRLEMRDSKARQAGGYWENPGKQQRYRELLDAQARMEGKR